MTLRWYLDMDMSRSIKQDSRFGYLNPMTSLMSKCFIQVVVALHPCRFRIPRPGRKRTRSAEYSIFKILGCYKKAPSLP